MPSLPPIKYSQEERETQWIEKHGDRFRPFPGVFCMSWRWPKWWGPPDVELGTEYGGQPFFVKGQPVRLLRFWSGTQVWQLLTPVHGFDAPGATLPDPKQTPFFPN